MKTNHSTVATAACTLVLALSSATALAVTKSRSWWHAASAVCDTNNPEFDPSMRRKVNEFRNVGTETIAVTCGTMTDSFVENGDFTQVVVYLQNYRAGTASVSCTIVAGTARDSIYSSTKSVAVASGGLGSLSWSPADYGDFRKHATLSCALPPGWSIRDLVVHFHENVGA